ncbi:MAG TPA: flagellar biosynthetic protein FliR [Terriglobales bacterium]|jgi:flagellar biosynthetic protein FliR
MQPFALGQILAGVIFTGVRVGGLMTFSPFLGSEAIPAPVKVGLTLTTTALLYPAIRTPQVDAGAGAWLQVIVGEAVIGLLMGLTVHLVLDAVTCAGQIVGMQMGFSLVTLFDPNTQADTPVLSIFHQLIALLIFLQLNVHHWLLRGLAASFSYLPPGSGVVRAGVAHAALQAVGAIWLVGMQVAAPIVVATMLSDIALGFLGKASPQLPVLLVGMSVKSMLGLVVLVGTVAMWPGMLERRFIEAIRLGEQLLHLAR